MAALSVILSVISLFTFWLVIPMFVLPPLAFFLGYKAHKAKQARIFQTSRAKKFLSLLPMVFAIAAFFLELYAINTGYRA
ncbi:hypothetical protein [Undibacterium sp.]|uniref:hypothetical protein n=1 Tax=Undibacterium sp. TaxID=1914977 RepID=UPI00374D3919